MRYTQSRDGMAQILLSPQMRSAVREAAELAQAIYQETVAKRTGALARSARVSTARGGVRNDRWVGQLTADAPHAAPHEFGVGVHPGSTGDGGVQQPVNDLNQVLNVMGTR
jgi:hypothetical protein